MKDKHVYMYIYVYVYIYSKSKGDTFESYFLKSIKSCILWRAIIWKH